MQCQCSLSVFPTGETASIHFTPCEIFIPTGRSRESLIQPLPACNLFSVHLLAVLADRDRHRDRADGDGVARGGRAEPRGDRAARPRHGHPPLRRLLRAAREGEAEEGRQQPHPGQLLADFHFGRFVTRYTLK